MINIKNIFKVLLLAILLTLSALNIIAQNTGVFFDDFNDNSLDMNKWTLYIQSEYSSFQEANGEAQFTVARGSVYGYSLLCSTALNLENWEKITITGKWKFIDPYTAEMRCFLHDANTNAYVGVVYATWDQPQHIRYYYTSGLYQRENRAIPTSYVDFKIVLNKSYLEYWENNVKIGGVATNTLANSNRFYLEIGGFETSGYYNYMFFDDISISVSYAEPPPEITISSPENLTTYYSKNIWLNVSADKTIVEWLYSLDGFANVSFNPNTTIYVEYGNHSLTVYARDTSGNIGSKTVYFWVYDLPEISGVSAIPQIQLVGGYVNITAIVYDYCSGVSFVGVNITDPDGQNSSFSMNKVEEGGEGDFYGGLYYLNQNYSKAGIYRYYIRAFDHSNNENVSLIYNFTITSGDITPPVITVISPEALRYYETTTIWLNVSADEEVSAWWFSLDGAENVSFMPNTTIEVLNEGYHYIVVYANDTAGNIGFVGVVFYVDLSAPAISYISANPSEQNAGGYVEIRSKVVDLVGVHEVWANITYPDSQSFSYPMIDLGDSIYALNQTYLKPGTYYYHIWAVDSLGHENSSAVYSFTILGDTTPPQLYFVNPPESEMFYNFSNLNVTLQSNEALENATLWWDGNDYEMISLDNIWYYELAGLLDGEYSYYATAYDLSGNYNATEMRKVTIDMREPEYLEILISSYFVRVGESLKISVRWYDKSLEKAWLESNESGSWQKLSEVSLEPSDDWSNFTLAFANVGIVGLKITARDKAGNYNSTPVMSVEVVKEPSIIYYSPEDPVYDSEGNSRTFTITTDQIVNVTWYIGEIEVFKEKGVNISSYKNSSALAGNYKVKALAENKNGTAYQIWNWIVSEKDKEPPLIYKINAFPSIQHQSGYVNISCYVEDNIAVSNVILKVQDPDGISSGIKMLYSGENYYYNSSYFKAGKYNFSIWANDTSGNENVSNTYSFEIIDVTPPIISYRSPTPENNSVLSSSTRSITISAVSNEPISQWILEWNGVNETIEGNESLSKTMGVSPGRSYSFRLYAKDLAGNIGDAGFIIFRVRSPSTSGGGGALPIPTPTPLPEGNVVNLNTKRVFESIQEAIDNISTLDGHEILVRVKPEPYEPIRVYKSLKIIGENKDGDKPRIHSSKDVAVKIEVSNVVFESFEIFGEKGKAETGIMIERALDCVIANTTLNDFGIGISLTDSGKTRIENNRISKADFGIYISGAYVYPEKRDGLSNNKVAGNSIENCREAVHITNSNENEINGNWISGNKLGIVLENSWWNKIYNNYLSNTLNALVSGKEKNYWNTEKILGKNIVGGIYLGGNYWNDYTNYEDRNGDGIGDTPHSIDEHNEDVLPLLKLPILNNRTKQVYPSISMAVNEASGGDEIIVTLKGKYYDNVLIRIPITIKIAPQLSLGDVVIVPSNTSQAVFTVKGSNVKIEGFVITGASTGILIENAQNCNITKNRLKGNYAGILLKSSTSNVITGNFILENEIGISMLDSTQNTIYNNYISNKNNTVLQNSFGNNWNIQISTGKNIINGTKLGGNFWGNYVGRDNNNDGIGDIPYQPVGEYSKDNYPLVKKLSRIYIIGNQNFTAENGVLYGTGKADDPFLIEGYSLFLDNNTPVVQIENTTAYFVLRNCEIYSNAPAVLLKNVKNGILENLFSNTSMPYGLPSTGIMLIDSTNNEIRSFNLTVQRTSEAGILLLNSSNNKIISNQIRTLVSRNLVDNTVYSGIKLNNSNGNSIERNNINNLLYGIQLVSSSSNFIKENDFSSNRKYGIFLVSSANNTISENDAKWCSITSDSVGIYLYSSAQNLVERNNASLNSLVGIRLELSANNSLKNNTVLQNSVGIKLESSTRNTLTNNIASLNNLGISIENSSVNSMSNNNLTSNAESGLSLLLSSNNTVDGNEIGCPEVAYPSNPSQKTGIKIQESSGNLFRNNTILNNIYGIHLIYTPLQASSGAFSSNTFYNNFIKSQQLYSTVFNTTSRQLEYVYYTTNVHVTSTTSLGGEEYYRDQVIKANKWNITKTAGKNIVGGNYLGGNYWSDYRGADTNGDKLGDTLIPHYGDYLPLMLATTGIHITKNSEFTAENGVIYGSGNATDPYVIANLEINAVLTHGIWIENTTAHFVVRNVTIYGGKLTLTTGVLLQNVTNGKIESVNLRENHFGISVERSSSIRIENCSLNSNTVGIAVEKSNNVSFRNISARTNGYGLILRNSTNATVQNSDFFNSSLQVLNSRASQINSSSINSGLNGIELQNCVGINITNNIVEKARGSGIHLFNSSVISFNNTVRENREANIRIQNSSNLAILMNNLSYSKVGVEVKNSGNLVLRGNKISNHYNLAEIGAGYGVGVENSDNITLSFNSFYANSVYSLMAMNSNVSIFNNKIVGSKNAIPARQGVFFSHIGVALVNSYGQVKDNYVAGNDIAVYLECQNIAKELSLFENTIAFSDEGIRHVSCSKEVMDRNRFFENNYGVKFYYPSEKQLRDSSFYINGLRDVLVETGGDASKVSLNRTYSGKGLNLTGGIRNLNEVSWDSAERGGDALKSAIVGINSTQFGFAKEVGGVISVHVSATANSNLSLFSGLYKERIYAVDTVTKEIHELYAKNFTARYGVLYPKSVDKDIVLNVYGLNNSIYDLFYEVIDTEGDRAIGYAQIHVKNAKIVITNVTSTTAERIYSLHRVPLPGQNFSSKEDYNTTKERGSFVYVTVKNQGIKGGFGIIKIEVPDYLGGIAGEINKVIYLGPNESANYTFYILLTKYDYIKGWTPSDPSVFPNNKKIPINITVQDLPSYITSDSKLHNISFKLGPIIRILSYTNYSYPRTPDPSAPYDGDGDGVIEAGEGYHFWLEFDNIGDEPANIQLFQHQEIIPCNSCKYNPPALCSVYPDHISRTEVFEPGMSFLSPEDFYKPQFWDTPNRLFGDLYPNGTLGISNQYYLRKAISNARIDWWFDRPDLGYYPPIDYSGREIIRTGVYYSIPGQGLSHRYHTISINSYNISVKALEKSFRPLQFQMADGDINALLHSVTIDKGVVNIRLENENEEVYYEYKFDGYYDPTPKGFKWYKVIPPEYTVEVFAEKAKQPNTTIPHMKANVGIKWSLWANELKLGMMTLEAVVSILLDEATGGAIDVEFADGLMSFTNVLLSLVNSYETSESTIPLTIEINKVQISTEELAEDGLDAEYFRRIANGDIDSSTATTFIWAVVNNDDLQKAFGREVLKIIAKNLGFEKVYIVLLDPNSPEDTFDDFREALLDYLKDTKRLTEDQADRIGKVVDAVMVFKDLGEWAYHNLAATRLEQRTLNILDPPEDFIVEISAENRTYFGGLYRIQIDGEGNVSIKFLEKGFVEISGTYSTEPDKMPFKIEGIEQIVVSLKGERIGDRMSGIAQVEITPKAGYALDAFMAFRNPQLQRSLIAGYFEKLQNLSAITEGDKIILIGEGDLAVSPEDFLLEGTIKINETTVEAKQRIVGYYAVETEGKKKLSIYFNPTIGVPMNKTSLEVFVGEGEGFESDLPFRKDGNVYRLDYLPDSLEANHLSAEKVQDGYRIYAIITLIVIASLVAIFLVFKKWK